METAERINVWFCKIFAELNCYYGQLYLVMETNIIEKINKYIQGTTSPVQRYYLYKELRKQLMSIIHQEFNDDDCPYKESIPSEALIFSKETSKGKKFRAAKNINEVKISYPFIEELSEGKFKTLPFFGESKE